MIKLISRPRKSEASNFPKLAAEPKRIVTWYYGGIVKNKTAPSDPKVIVWFRHINNEGKLGQFIQKSISLTHLASFPIGSVWEKGKYVADSYLEEKEFEIDFTFGSWDFVSPSCGDTSDQPSPIDPKDYPLRWERDKNWLIDFPLPHGRNLLIPCIELFMQAYGISKEIQRVLVTYPWDQAQPRLWIPFDQPIKPGCWPTRLAKRIQNPDYAIVAHLQHDEYAQIAAREIYGQVESSFVGGDSLAFIKVRPWFQGTNQLSVSGFWINKGKTFLGLRMNGRSDPQGPAVQYDRENNNSVEEPSPVQNARRAWPETPVSSRGELNDTSHLTDDYEPDHGLPNIEFIAREFKILGTPRLAIPVRRQQAVTTSGTKILTPHQEAFSSGEPYGTGKAVGYASIQAKLIMDSEGVLRDMWNAARHVHATYPDVIRAVSWFTFECSFQEDNEPLLIPLEPFDRISRLNMSTDVSNWLYRDVATRKTRGVLVIRIETSMHTVYIVEIERRSYKSESGYSKEERLTGLAFTLNDDTEFINWIRLFLSNIRYAKGVIHRIVDNCPGTAAVFKHGPPNEGKALRERTVLNAIKKLGIQIHG